MMNMRAKFFILLMTMVLCNTLWADERRPNVMDDHGYGDMSCHGNPYLKTPAMDRTRCRWKKCCGQPATEIRRTSRSETALRLRG
jgi:hypothetical protein